MSDVSISWGYLLVQMPLWQPLYLHWLNICCCRCSFLGRYICKTLIFAVADALFLTNVSATCFSLSLQILFSLPVMLNCIYILPFLEFEDTSFANFASTSHVFDNMRMLLIEILHPLLALSMPCGCSPVKLRILALSILCGCSPSKFCIFNFRKSTIADIVAQYPLLLFTSQLEPIHYLQKIDIRNSSEYGVSVGGT